MMRIPTFAQFQNESEMISQQYSSMEKLQQQAETGKKLLSPSDDPVLAGQLQSIQDYINQMGTYTDNGDLITERNKLYDSTTKTIMSTISDIQGQLAKAQSGTVNAGDKATIANQLQSDLNALLNAANTTDQNGQYIFSGSNASSPAYAMTGGSYQYQGGADSTSIEIGPNATALYNDVGSQVFGNIPLGNGTFTVSASNSNTGTAVASAGSVTSISQYVADPYAISIVTNNEGQPAIQVVDSKSGQQVIPASGGDAPAYVPGTAGQDVSFNGITLNIGPGAQLGDSFTVTPSTNQDVFDTLQGIINNINNPSLSPTQFSQAMSQANASVSQIMNHFVDYQSATGSREQITNNQLQANSQIILNQTTLQSNLGDADITQVFSALMQQSIALQATQQSYMQMQDTLTQLLKL